MAVYLIAYDIGSDERRRKLADRIREHWPCEREQLSESAYAVSTTMTGTALYNWLQTSVIEDDRLFVIRLRRPCLGTPDKSLEWLLSALPE